jgi:hypothetical protein
MTLTDLLGLPVFSPSQEKLGSVVEVQLRSGLGADASRLFVDGVLISTRPHIRLLGFDRSAGPWLVRVLLRRLEKDVRFADWGQLEMSEGRLTLQVRWDQLAPYEHRS